MEVRDVNVCWTSELHIDSIRGFIKDYLRDKVHSINQLAAENHQLVIAVFMPDLQVYVIVLQFLNEIV